MSAEQKPQLSREDLKAMTHQEITQARVDGRLDDLLSGKPVATTKD